MATEGETAPAPQLPPEVKDALAVTPVPAKPAPGARPQDNRRPPRSGGGGGGGKRRDREREPVRTLDSDLDYKNKFSPNIHDLDVEIAGELEAAMLGMDQKSLLGADTSKKVRKTTEAKPDGGRKKGKVISVRGADVFVEIPGGRGQGLLMMEQFPEGAPKIGDEVDVSIEGYDPIDGLLILTRKGAILHVDWASVSEGMVVEARVLETNKGGLSVDVNGIKGFMPISQIDRFRVENVEQYVNQRLRCMITEVDPSERNLVVSRRAMLEKERAELQAKLWEELQEGQIKDGIVGNVRDFGAFVDIGGIDGLLHVSEISWKRIADASTVLAVGQAVKVVILKIDRETKKLSLGLKQLESNPWDNIHEKYHIGQLVKGTVSRTMDFGAFVELEPGIEGLIHVSELARGKVWRVTDVVKAGQEVEAKILGVDPEQRRISLSLREALPVAVVKTDDDGEEDNTPDEPVAPRKRNYALKGGVGGGTWIAEPGAEK